MPRGAPFPFEAVRDLLGLLRAMWLATPAENRRRREQIAAVAQELRKAADLARGLEVEAIGHRMAWERAERALTKLGDLVDVTTPIEPVIQAAAKRVTKRR